MIYYAGFGAPAGAAVLPEDENTWQSYPAPPVVTVEQAWQSPGVAQQRIPEESSSSSFDWKGMTSGLVGGLVDIFGRRVAAPPVYRQPPPSPGVPLWVWIGIPVALIGVVAMTRRRPSVAGYRRRKSRR